MVGGGPLSTPLFEHRKPWIPTFVGMTRGNRRWVNV
jgi:hypothetical protein